MNALNIVALTLLIVGGLNWGLYGLMGLDLVAAIAGANTMLANIIYMLVGLSAVYAILFYRYVTTHQTTNHLRPSSVH